MMVNNVPNGSTSTLMLFAESTLTFHGSASLAESTRVVKLGTPPPGLGITRLMAHSPPLASSGTGASMWNDGLVMRHVLVSEISNEGASLHRIVNAGRGNTPVDCPSDNGSATAASAVRSVRASAGFTVGRGNRTRLLGVVIRKPYSATGFVFFASAGSRNSNGCPVIRTNGIPLCGSTGETSRVDPSIRTALQAPARGSFGEPKA